MTTEPRHDGERTSAGPFDVLAREAYGALPKADRRPDADTPPPHRSRFEVLGEISRDPTSVLLRGRDLELDREVALKVLEDRGRGVAAFLEEAQLGAQLQHPGILPVLGLGYLEDGRAYLALRRVKGETLAELLERDVGARRLLPLLEQAANAVAFAHARGVAHGNLRAASVVVGRHGQVVVRGWDAAVRTNGDSVPVSEDVRALGALLELAIGDTVNGDLAAMTRRCRSEDPAERPRHAGEVARAIGAHLAAEEARARDAELDAARARASAEENRAREALEQKRADLERRSRRRTLTLAAAILVAVVLGGTGLAWKLVEDRAAAGRAEAEVTAAIRQARQHEAAGDPSGAMAWAAKAVALARSSEVKPGTVARAESVRNRIVRADDDARRGAALLRRLETLAGDMRAWSDWDAVRADREYEAAFREFGIDPERQSAEQAAETVRSMPDPDEIVSYLDHWRSIRNEAGRRDARLAAIARLADADGTRDMQSSRPEPLEMRLARLDVARQPRRALESAARALGLAGKKDQAQRLLDEAHRRYPGDHRLSAFLGSTASQTTWRGNAERRLHFTVEVAARPDSYRAWASLYGALEQLAFLNRYEALLQEIEAVTRRMIALRPRHALGYRLLGRFLVDRGRHAEAEAAVRRSLELDPDDMRAYWDLGNLLARQGRADEARAAGARALEIDPESGWAHLGLAFILRHLGEREEAAVACREALARAPGDALLLYAVGKVYRNIDMYEEAVKTYRAALDLAPDHVMCRNSLGAILCDHLGRYDEAIEQFEKAIRLDPDVAEVHYNLGTARMRKQQDLEALRCFRRSLELGGDTFAVHMGLGWAYLKLGMPEPARQAFERVLELEPDGGYAHYGLGMALMGLGRFEDAERSLRRSLELPMLHSYSSTDISTDELRSSVCAILGEMYLARLELEKALEVLEAGVRLSDRNPLPRIVLGGVRHMLGDKSGAAADFRRALVLAESAQLPASVDRAPTLVYAKMGLSWLIATSNDPELGTLDEALRLAREAAACPVPPPLSIFQRITLGVALVRADRPEEALEHLEQPLPTTISLDPAGAESCRLLFLAIAQAKLDRPTEARKTLDRAVELKRKSREPDEEDFAHFRAQAEALLR